MTARRFLIPAVLSCVVLVAGYQAVRAGSALLRNSAVGGVMIDTDGTVSEPTEEAWQRTRASWEEFLEAPPAEMASAVAIRKISLKQLEAALEQAVQRRGGDIPQEIRFMAGLQRIEYLLVYPEKGDIVLAGPGEGWRVSENGAVVGETTGLPVVQLDDLLIAFRTVRAARQGTISCSIEPSPEGVQAMQQIMRRARRFQPGMLEAIEQAMGPQNILVQGVPDTSHFARVMVAADYRMKRIAMHLEPSPIPELPSFLEIAQKTNAKFGNVMPRWWLACDYQPLARSEDGLAWQLRGQGVKVLTEQNLVAADGTATPIAGRRLPAAERWAETMTEHYEKLAQHQPIFAQLRNLMDLCVLAALIEKEDLLTKSNLGSIPYVMGDMVADSYNPPRTVSTQCSFLRQRDGYIITASGGVEIDSWSAASKSEVDPSLAPLRQQQQPSSSSAAWWWN